MSMLNMNGCERPWGRSPICRPFFVYFSEGGSAKSEKPKTANPVPAQQAPPPEKASKPTATGQVLTIVKAPQNGVDVATLRKETGFDDKKIRSIFSKAYKQGKIRRVGKEIYIGA
jgi:hypothetical protein